MDNILIEVQPKAAEKFQAILQENNLPEDTLVRVYLKAGGCSGFEIKIDIEEELPGKFDLTFESSGVNMIIDKKSALFLKGMTIDWEGGMMGGFKFNPPNSTGGCGCGVSFSFTNG